MGLSGCADFQLDGSPDVPTYATWLPAPERVFEDPESSDDEAVVGWYPFRARRLDELAAYYESRDATFERTALYQDGTMAHPVLDIGPSDAYLEVRGGGRGLSVLETDLLEDDIVAAFRTPESGEPVREPFEEVGEHRGYRLLAAPDGNWVVGVDGGVVVEAFASMGAGPLRLREKRSVCAAIIDARAGQGRYTGADRPLEELVQRLGTGTVISGSRNPTAGAGDPLATGVAHTTEETENAREVRVFDGADVAEAHEVDTDAGTTGGWSDATVTRDGRAVVVEGTSHPL